ncbi:MULTISPECIES: hypothetical protein [unclassified Streptomyces]|uniref:hypothetical protein n=1 Tax=unclassified Streptomyces TaxID=2593676 RepID=UPI00339F92E9
MPALQNEQAVRGAAERVVELALTDDMAYHDSLPYEVQIEMSTPLVMVAEALGEGCELVELQQRVSILLSAAAQVTSQVPEELRVLLEDLRFAGRQRR